jgi:hypothetical protein
MLSRKKLYFITIIWHQISQKAVDHPWNKIKEAYGGCLFAVFKKKLNSGGKKR